MVNRKRVPVVWKYAEPKNPFRDPHAEPPQYVRAKAGHRLAVGIHPLRFEITGPRWWDEACRRYFPSLAEIEVEIFPHSTRKLARTSRRNNWQKLQSPS